MLMAADADAQAAHRAPRQTRPSRPFAAPGHGRDIVTPTMSRLPLPVASASLDQTAGLRGSTAEPPPACWESPSPSPPSQGHRQSARVTPPRVRPSMAIGFADRERSVPQNGYGRQEGCGGGVKQSIVGRPLAEAGKPPPQPWFVCCRSERPWCSRDTGDGPTATDLQPPPPLPLPLPPAEQQPASRTAASKRNSSQPAEQQPAAVAPAAAAAIR
ncbi:hypothetical protein CDD83_8744 [Cordyceps sp. RAO-2017]|nr:hypothetical protein CDD83_8744 [Cordyceps sp. RAO-2017]